MLLKRDYFIIVLIISSILFAFAILPFLYIKRTDLNKENRSLFKSAEQFKSFLKRKNIKGIYSLFNRAFQKEIPEAKFTAALAEWFNGKKMRRVETKFINVTGFTGQASTWVWQSEKDYLYLFTSWIKTESGWRLLWLTPILSQDFAYGQGDLAERRILLGLAIREAFSRQGFGDMFPKLNLPRHLVFLKKGRPEEGSNLPDSNLPVLWLTLDEIRKKYQYLSLPFYFDYGAIRIIDNLATVYLDILPIKKGNQPFLYTRGLQFQFQKNENGVWEFVGYGSRW